MTSNQIATISARGPESNELDFSSRLFPIDSDTPRTIDLMTVPKQNGIIEKVLNCSHTVQTATVYHNSYHPDKLIVEDTEY
jgi:hypothetical protein